MKQPRLSMSKIINGAMFNIVLLENCDGRHILKLLSKVKKGKCYVSCKYKEFNEVSGIKDGVTTYTSVRYAQSAQIKDINSRGDIAIYDMLLIGGSSRLSGISATFNNIHYKIMPGSTEFYEFENFLKNLMPKLDDFSRNFIDCMIDAILTREPLNQTPKYVEDIVNIINTTNYCTKK